MNKAITFLNNLIFKCVKLLSLSGTGAEKRKQSHQHLQPLNVALSI
jgi:hypothetical protein